MNIIKTRQADEIKNVVNPVINIPVRETINIPNIELDNDQMPVAENEEEVIENEIIDLEKEEVEINEMIDELESLEF